MILSICDTSTSIRLFLLAKYTINIICILIPLILIIISSIEIFKVVISGKHDDLKASISIIAKRIIAGMIIFLIPSTTLTIFNMFLNFTNTSKDITTCYKTASLAKYESTKKTEKEKLEQEKEQNKNENKDSFNKRNEEEKAKNETLKKEQQKEENNAPSNINENTTPESTQEPQNTEPLTEGTSNTYFAPIQNAKYSISAASSTPGCTNASVNHDLRVAANTPIYAAADGTAYFYQSVCGDTLYSYGNSVKLVLPDNTYIRYAHMSSFGLGVTASTTKTCNAPCSYTTCSSGVKQKLMATKEIKKGDVIGYVGRTGNALGVHLHVEIHEKGSKSCVTNPYKEFGM